MTELHLKGQVFRMVTAGLLLVTKTALYCYNDNARTFANLEEGIVTLQIAGCFQAHSHALPSFNRDHLTRIHGWLAMPLQAVAGHVASLQRNNRSQQPSHLLTTHHFVGH